MWINDDFIVPASVEAVTAGSPDTSTIWLTSGNTVNIAMSATAVVSRLGLQHHLTTY